MSSTFSKLLERRVDDGDQYCPRHKLLIDNITIKRGESPNSIRTTIWNEINRLGVDINKCEVDRAHRAEHLVAILVQRFDLGAGEGHAAAQLDHGVVDDDLAVRRD